MLAKIPLKLTPYTNERAHWRTLQKRKQQEKRITKAIMVASPKMGLPLLVTFTRYSPRKLDDDNLPSCFKYIRDEVARWFGCGDSPDDPISWVYKQEKAKEIYSTIQIEEVKE